MKKASEDIFESNTSNIITKEGKEVSSEGLGGKKRKKFVRKRKELVQVNRRGFLT